MRALLLPVKDLTNAKQRLAPLLSPAERRALAHAMLADTVQTLRAVRRADKIFVVTNYAPAIEIASENAWQVLLEHQQVSESASVDAASRECAQLGVTALLRLPLDLPLIQSSDVDELLSIDCAAPAAIIVPSRDGTGTNALLRIPATLFPSHFGPGSYAKHCAEARRSGAQLIELRNPRLEMDVDDPSDLVALVQHDLFATVAADGTATARWLRENRIAQRLQCLRSPANENPPLAANA